MVVVNTRQLATGARGGVARFTEQVLDELRAEGVTVETIAPPRWMPTGVLGHLWEQLVLPVRMLAPSRRGQMLVCPANVGPLLVRRQRVTVHDVAPLDHPEWFGSAARLAFKLIVPRLARRVDEVVTVSAFARARIAATCSISPDRIDIVEPRVASCFVPPPDEIERRDVVVLAGADPRKNAETALAAWKAIADRVPGHRCIVVTGRRNPGVFADTASPVGDRVDTLVDADDETLVRALQSAAVAVFVSHYEGYGLPPLEAAACGAPVVVSDAVPSVAERADASGFAVVPATDHEAIAAAILDAINA